jgi:ankyrin repeat protein
LQAATEKGYSELIKFLIEAGADVNQGPATEGGATALQLSAMHGLLGIATFLIDAEADVNAEAAPLNGRTALEAAAEHGWLDIVKPLLDSGLKTLESVRSQYLRAQNFA